MSIVLPKSMADVEATREFPLAPAGTYEFEIKEVKQGTSQKGNTKLDFKCAIINDEDHNNITVFDTCTITEEALWRLKQLCLATDIELDDEFDPQEFVGATFEATINVSTYTTKDGETREKNEITKFVFDAE